MPPETRPRTTDVLGRLEGALMHHPTAVDRTTLPAPPDDVPAEAATPAPLLFVPLAACLTPRGDAAIMVARLRHQLARLDAADRAYIVDLVRRHIVAERSAGA